MNKTISRGGCQSDSPILVAGFALNNASTGQAKLSPTSSLQTSIFGAYAGAFSCTISLAKWWAARGELTRYRPACLAACRRQGTSLQARPDIGHTAISPTTPSAEPGTATRLPADDESYIPRCGDHMIGHNARSLTAQGLSAKLTVVLSSHHPRLVFVHLGKHLVS